MATIPSSSLDARPKRVRESTPPPTGSPPADRVDDSLRAMATALSKARRAMSSTSIELTVQQLMDHMLDIMGAVAEGITEIALVTKELRQAPLASPVSVDFPPLPSSPSPLQQPSRPPPPLLHPPQQRAQQQRGPAPSPASGGGRKTYVDRLKHNLEQETAPEKRRVLAGKLLFRRAPVERRLVHAASPLHDEFGEKVKGIEMVYVKGIPRMPFTEIRKLLTEMSPTELDGKHVLHISYFGPVTAFMCIDSFTAERLIEDASELGGTVQPDFDPTKPLGSGERAQSVAAAEKAFCERVARDIQFTTNLLVGTYLYRGLAPRLTARIGEILGVSPRGRRARATPVAQPGAMQEDQPPRGSAASTPASADDGEMAEGTE